MPLGGRGTRLPSDLSILTVSGSLEGKTVRIYTSNSSGTVVNYCSTCERPYCDLQNLSTSSTMSFTAKVVRCPHSGEVEVYLLADEMGR